ncbi:pheromone A receptor-domain-containing protein [Lactifluus volemus]|nr:pheromone A receptor-domain-containing protein [Lactifluus volemus]
MGSAVNQAYSVFSFIGFWLSVTPLYWHLQAWNTGTCMYMIWTAIGCLTSFINSILWRGNVIDKAPIYCDIVTRVQVGFGMGIPACTLCINRRLYKILVRQAVTVTQAEKRRTVTIDLLITVGIPVLAMGLQYIVTPYSYGIFEDLGCLTLTSYTVPALLFFNLWPVLIGSVAFVYCSMVLYHFFKRKNQLAEVMSSHEGMRRSRYIRLMLLASSEMIITVPYSSFLLSTVFKAGLYKFHWSTLRHNYTHVPQYTTVQWQSDPVTRVILEVDVWSLVYCAFIFFAFFGFADEARVHYRRAYSSITRRVGFSKSSGTFTGSTHAMSSSKTGGAMVSVVQSRNRRGSITLSFTDQLSIPSISIPGDLISDSKIEQDSPLESTLPSSSSSLVDGPLDRLPQLPDRVSETSQPASTYTSDGADAV